MLEHYSNFRHYLLEYLRMAAWSAQSYFDIAIMEIKAVFHLRCWYSALIKCYHGLLLARTWIDKTVYRFFKLIMVWSLPDALRHLAVTQLDEIRLSKRKESYSRKNRTSIISNGFLFYLLRSRLLFVCYLLIIIWFNMNSSSVRIASISCDLWLQNVWIHYLQTK